MKKFSNGFTIVEILIVIVIIGILAAITTATFSGLAARAEVARTSTAVSSYLKAIELYKVTNGTYPDTGHSCMGTAADYPASNNFAAGACITANGNPDAAFSSSLNTALAPFLSAPPTVQTPPVTVVYDGTLTMHFRGVWVESRSSFYQYQFWLKGNTSCPVGDKTYNASANATRCLKLVG